MTPERSPPAATPPVTAAANSDTAPSGATLTAAGNDASSNVLSLPVPHAGLDGSNPKSLVKKSFDDFEILELVGQGGMGVVYKARQKSLDRIVALKMLLAEAFENANVRARFLEEAKLAASLSHPNIVSIYQVGQCPAGHYFVMEFLEGEGLDSLIQRGPIPLKWVLAIMPRVADAVHYAHTKGVIHRDLKPANIMMHAVRGPIVMDFGVAKVLGRSANPTQLGAVIGTPAYMPPEQAGDDPEAMGPLSDVYSLGAVLYALLTGRAPYGEGKALATILKVVSPEPPPSVRSLRPDTPLELEALCMKCLAKKPGDRYANAKVLGEELRRMRSLPPAPVAQPVARVDRPQADRPSLTLVEATSGKEITFTKRRTVIGRGKDCHLIVQAADVSKVHCQILVAAEETLIEDLGSSNGTFVNGTRIDRAHLDDGDQIAVGEHHFQVRLSKS